MSGQGGLVVGTDGFTLPIEAATGTHGILATKGAGKSNAAVVMAEALWDAGVPWVAIDPKGDWYGVRSSASGTEPGLPVPVFGGRHGDIPLEPTAGSVVAALILEHRLSCVLDVSQFTKADVVRFLLAFGDYLFRHADDDGAEPLHLFLEEAHEYLPQSFTGKDNVAQLVSVWQRIVKQGRFKGLGSTIVSQRSSAVNKDVLELVDTLIVLRTVGPLSRKAIQEWVRGQDVDEGLLDSLPSLLDGEAWVWSPGGYRLMERIRFRRRRTFDSGATPKVGQSRRPPATLADIDLGAIKDQMAETIERAEAEDPKALRRRIRDLERELTEAHSATPEPVIERVLVTAEVVPPAAVDAARSLVDGLGRALSGAQEALAVLEGYEPPSAPVRAPVARPQPRPAPARRPVPAPSGDGSSDLTGPQRKLLTVLATYGPRSKRQLAMQAGYSSKGGGFNNPLSSLRSQGLVERGDPIVITQAGFDALGEVDPLPVGQALIDHWMGQLKGPEQKILRPLIDIWPDTMSKEDLAAVAGYDPSGGGFNNPLSRLRSLELVRRGPDIGLTDDFGEAIQ